MALHARTLLWRVGALLALAGAVVSGALLAVRGHTEARRKPQPPAPVTIAGPMVPGGDAEPVATVLPPDAAASATGDSGTATALAWPPPLLNPTAHLRTAWDLALGRPSAREVLFTFDDGPNPGTTDRLLGYLDRYHVKAVFFVCGWRLEGEEPLRTRARNLLREELARGHVVGNHTVHHLNMATLGKERIAREIDHNADLIEEITGQRPHLFRPPYGSYSDDVRSHVVGRGDELFLWSADSHDWQHVGDAQTVAMNVIVALGNMAGGTVLLHDTHPWSVSAAQMVFRWLETENRDRIAAHRTPYRVVDAREFIDGARNRLPIIAAAMEEERRQNRHNRRDDPSGGMGMGGGGGGPDAGAVAPSAPTTPTTPATQTTPTTTTPGSGAQPSAQSSGSSGSSTTATTASTPTPSAPVPRPNSGQNQINQGPPK